ncbi:LuxR C-terminal-related transcriptional regulator [Streptomyces sp. DT2A-34]|uniref:LuxR C-terminal-related transcriptional regulator n=1 Tax=Streptomyces sp. DT2A-34 TaxID=3051182 RepID=UPI00265C308E|nr:LuxR C-terminal-related transcriptional regulator [Streptomyces sp. DT2A-34]MDO0916638.1 LuxR C-terminal-related transcriptional regulator [Streptomyces sp. DT2A-34]
MADSAPRCRPDPARCHRRHLRRGDRFTSALRCHQHPDGPRPGEPGRADHLLPAADPHPDLRHPPSPVLDQLSARERQILILVATQPDNNALARLLGLSPLTVKSHVNRILRKFGVSTRAQLVAIAYESGLVTPGLPVGGMSHHCVVSAHRSGDRGRRYVIEQLRGGVGQVRGRASLPRWR